MPPLSNDHQNAASDQGFWPGKKGVVVRQCNGDEREHAASEQGGGQNGAQPAASDQGVVVRQWVVVRRWGISVQFPRKNSWKIPVLGGHIYIWKVKGPLSARVPARWRRVASGLGLVKRKVLSWIILVPLVLTSGFTFHQFSKTYWMKATASE